MVLFPAEFWTLLATPPMAVVLYRRLRKREKARSPLLHIVFASVAGLMLSAIIVLTIWWLFGLPDRW